MDIKLLTDIKQANIHLKAGTTHRPRKMTGEGTMVLMIKTPSARKRGHRVPVPMGQYEPLYDGSKFSNAVKNLLAELAQEPIFAGTNEATEALPAVGNEAITLNEAKNFIVDFTEHMYRAYNIDHHRTFVRRGNGSCHRKIDGKSRIEYGVRGLKSFIALGYSEYKSIAYIWHQYGEMRGKKAAWALAIHEFAHVLQERDGTMHRSQYSGRRKVHGRDFVAFVYELQEKFPYDEVA